ncbi:zinc ribbon domain-containing protein [Mesobacillus maritimus]|uniref:zinc ribbon domain-containing protein n=1 Tax=Mesobacillus maritimus TaxID=1643336 RepID=UPI00203FB98B|nr:zinc ribbon domain-containing protein [Mesobacillus maritimus]MCM3668646.1 zinc ribbon domain-containing protein [Mesobacillus maritimus]
MYCKTCGEKNFSPSNYCVRDGTYQSQEKFGFKLSGKRKFCQDCGRESRPHFNYCLSCGSALGLYTSKQNKRTPSPVSVIEKDSKMFNSKLLVVHKLSIEQFKKGLFPAILSVVILAMLSFVVLNVSQNFVQDFVFNETTELDEITRTLENMALESEVEIPDLTNMINLTDVMLYANLQGSVIEWSATGDGEAVRGTFELENSAVIYMALPLISLFVGGLILGRRNRETVDSLLSMNFAMAIIYALVLAVISLFAGFSYSASFVDEYFSVDFTLVNQYSFVRTLVFSFVFAFVFAGLGSLFSENYRKFSGQLSSLMPYGEGVHQAFSTIVRGIGIWFVVGSIFFFTKVHDLKENIGWFLGDTPMMTLLEKGFIVVVSLSAQFSTYVWNLLHLAPLTLTVRDDTEEMTVNYSIINGVTSSDFNESEFHYVQQLIANTDIGFYLKVAIILPILLFLWAGYRISLQQENTLMHMVVFSITYGVLMSFVASITDLVFATTLYENGYPSKQMGFMLGFSTFGIFIRSFLFAFIFAYIGTWLRNINIRTKIVRKL